MRIPARRDGVCVARGLRRRFRGAARTCVGVRSGLTRWTRVGTRCVHWSPRSTLRAPSFFATTTRRPAHLPSP